MKISWITYFSINLGASDSSIAPIDITVSYSGKVLAISLIWFKILYRELFTFLNTLTASCTSNLVTCDEDGNVGILVFAI